MPIKAAFFLTLSAEALYHPRQAPIESYLCHPRRRQAWRIAWILSKPIVGSPALDPSPTSSVGHEVGRPHQLNHLQRTLSTVPNDYITKRLSA